MIKSNKNAFLVLALVCCMIGFSSCGMMSSSDTSNGNTSVVTNSANKANTAAANSTTTPAKTETAAADKVGVPECDEYIEKYEACIKSKVPEAQRAMYKSSFDTMRKTWKDAAATPQGKAGLASACKTVHDAAKQSMSSYSCAW